MKKQIKRLIAIALCAIIGFSTVACNGKTAGTKSGEEEKKLEDIRNEKMINQQQAMLRFTTEYKAGSVVSVQLHRETFKDKDNKDTAKYVYKIIALTKKNQVITMIVDAENTEVLKKVEGGPASNDMLGNYIDYVPVMNAEKLYDKAVNYSKKGYKQILGYRLFSVNNVNIYEFTLGDDYPDAKNTEKIYLNAENGNKIELKDGKYVETDKDGNSKEVSKPKTDANSGATESKDKAPAEGGSAEQNPEKSE